MAFLKSQRNLPNLMLCGNPLPWTEKCKHLGTTLTNKIDGCEEDMKVKNVMYAEKNIELNQEFFFAHPSPSSTSTRSTTLTSLAALSGTSLAVELRKLRAATTDLSR